MSATDYKAADDGAVTSASAPPMMVHVVAPSSLPEGYTFEANINNDPERTFTVEVVSILGRQHAMSCLGNILFGPSFTHPITRPSSTTVLETFVRIPSHPFLFVVYIYYCVFNNSPLEA